jgi:hypothetical protein
MLEYYRLRQSQYERLIGYLRQRRVEVNNALVSLGGNDLNGLGRYEGEMFGRPIDAHASYADITANKVWAVTGKQWEALNNLDAAIRSAEQAAVRYANMIANQCE